MFVAITVFALTASYIIYCMLGSNAHHKGWMNAKEDESMSTLFVPMIFIPRFLKGYIASARQQGHQTAYGNWTATNPNSDTKEGTPLPSTIIIPAKFPYGSKSAKAYIDGYNNFFKQQEKQKRQEIEASIFSSKLARL